jgi:small neutral amino acid transporter SnatA (MarC family)
MLLIAREPSRWFEWLLSLVCAWLISGIILLWSGALGRILGPKVLEASERLMGMLVTAVAVEMLVAGIRETFLPS